MQIKFFHLLKDEQRLAPVSAMMAATRGNLFIVLLLVSSFSLLKNNFCLPPNHGIIA